MNLGMIGSIALAIVGVAIVFTVVGSTNTAPIIKAGGDAFAQALQSATGKSPAMQ